MATAKKTKSKATKQPKASSSATSALEKAIEKAPDAPDAYLVYADHLTELGDPLGELISVQAKIASSTKKSGLEKVSRREKELLAAHEGEWLGSIAQISKGHERRNPFTGQMQHFPARQGPVLRFGFIESMRVFGEDELEELLSLRLARFIRRLELQFPFEPAIAKLAALGVPRTLKRLAFVLGDYDQLSWTQLGDLSVLYPKLKQLEELQITAGIMDLGAAIHLPALKSFEVITGGLTRANVRSIASAKWPRLERLSIYFGSSEYGSSSRITDLKPILKGDGLKRLTHLGLCNSESADEIAKTIVSAPIVKQLHTLDLSKGTMSETGAEHLIKGASKLKHLKRIDLSKNFLTLEAQEELEETFKSIVDLSDQGDGDDDFRYVQVSE